MGVPQPPKTRISPASYNTSHPGQSVFQQRRSTSCAVIRAWRITASVPCQFAGSVRSKSTIRSHGERPQANTVTCITDHTGLFIETGNSPNAPLAKAAILRARHTFKSLVIRFLVGVCRTARSYHNSISFLSRPVLLIRTIALALLVLGPLVGSIDVDADGAPDVPMVFMIRSVVEPLSPETVIMQPSGVPLDAAEYASPRSFTHPVGTDISAVTSHSVGFVVRSSSRLRC